MKEEYIQEELSPKRTVIGGFANTLGRSFSYFFIYIATTAYTLLLIPHIFKLVQLADSSTLIPFLLPYLLSVTFFSMLISRFVKERESIILLMVFTSMPFLLLSGISWPTNALPGFWKVISWCIPSTFGINGFVNKFFRSKTSMISVQNSLHCGLKWWYTSS